MPDSPQPSASRPLSTPAHGAAESVLIVPLAPLFAPVPDPSAEHPDESAEVEGYVVSPEGRATLALASGGAQAAELLESVWSALEERGVAERRWSRADDQGRTVAVVSLRVPEGQAAEQLMRRTVVLPVRVRAGFAEIHLLADVNETQSVERELRRIGITPSSITSDARADTPRGHGLSAEDWALMGLLQAVGVFDPRDAPHQAVVAEVIGVPPAYLDRRVRAIEHGLQSLVTTLFAPIDDREPEAA